MHPCLRGMGRAGLQVSYLKGAAEKAMGTCCLRLFLVTAGGTSSERLLAHAHARVRLIRADSAPPETRNQSRLESNRIA